MHLLNNLQNCTPFLKQHDSLSRSEVGYTTWSKLKRNGPVQRSPIVVNPLISHISRHARTCFVRKSLSMPNLQSNVPQHHPPVGQHPLNVSQAPAASHNSAESFDRPTTMRTLLPIMQDSGKCSSNGGAGARPGCDEEEFQLDSLDAQINNNNNNNNNGSHGDDEEEEELDGAGPPVSPRRAQGGAGVSGQMKLNDFNRQVHCSPRRQYKGYNMNIGGGRSQGMKNPVVHGLLHNHSGSSTTGAASPLNSSSSINNNNHNVNNNNSFKDTNSDTSRTSENLTQIFNHSGNNNTSTAAAGASSKTKISIDMITKSMQTSLIGTPVGAAASVRDKVRVIPPSFLDRLNELGDKQKAPVFVVYPNYVLPDLGFLKTQNEVVISPLSFKETMKGTARPPKKARPVSMNDIETIRQREYKHVMDWKSLLFLLPTDYRKLLRHIPEVGELSISTEKQPMFCMTPPLRRGVARGVNCDCVNLLHQNTQTCNSSSSGGSSSAAPSSGYRGSSTILTTDSEMDGILGPSNSSNTFSNNLYVYQYDSPAEVLASCERPPSGRTGVVAPKSILRRPAGSTRSGAGTGASNNNAANLKAKRSSMFEEQPLLHYAQGTREKRRSLQEHHSYNFYEDAEEQEACGELLPGDHKLHNSPNMTPHPRLANTPKLPSADHYHKLNKLVEMSEREMGATSGQAVNDDDSEARARAEQFLSHIKFSTPPNSPNMSVTVARQQQGPTPTGTIADKKPPLAQRTPSLAGSPSSGTEKEKQDKIQTNRFKRLQIQWELLSQEASTRAACDSQRKEIRSGGNTPTGGNSTSKSRIPRPVSYPTTRTNSDPVVSKTLKSPSRIVPPRKYAAAAASPATTPPTPAPRTPNKTFSTTTPKKVSSVPSRQDYH
uniref:Uncharacterized protein n=1 Tax=Anopheles atroparvus TaxID=41427 RepID=A0A182IWV7_ANOAO